MRRQSPKYSLPMLLLVAFYCGASSGAPAQSRETSPDPNEKTPPASSEGSKATGTNAGQASGMKVTPSGNDRSVTTGAFEYEIVSIDMRDSITAWERAGASRQSRTMTASEGGRIAVIGIRFKALRARTKEEAEAKNKPLGELSVLASGSLYDKEFAAQPVWACNSYTFQLVYYSNSANKLVVSALIACAGSKEEFQPAGAVFLPCRTGEWNEQTLAFGLSTEDKHPILLIDEGAAVNGERQGGAARLSLDAPTGATVEYGTAESMAKYFPEKLKESANK